MKIVKENKDLKARLSQARKLFPKIRELKKAFIEHCKEEKLEVCNFEDKESWLIVTIDPESYRGFTDALSNFLCAVDELLGVLGVGDEKGEEVKETKK